MGIDKIIYIADIFLPSFRANSVNSIKMCEAFAAHGKEVLLIIPYATTKKTEKEILEYYGVKSKFSITQLKIPKIPGSLFIFMLRAYLFVSTQINKSHKSYIIYGRSPLAISLLSILKYRTAIDVHGLVWKKNVFRKFAFWFLSRSRNNQLISFNTDQLLDRFQNSYRGIKTKLIAVQNGADIPLNTNIYELESNSSLNIGYLGSFSKGRGIELIFEIARLLPEVNFHLAGNHDNFFADNTHAHKPSNIYLYGHLSYHLTQSFRNSCDVLIAPYQTDVTVPSGENTVDYMSPIKVFEYMSSKKAIIASDLPSIRLVLNNQNSYLVTCNNSQEWVSAILKLKNESIRNKIAENSYRDFLRNYTWDRRIEKILIELK